MIAITLETCHAVEVLQEAFNRRETPEIDNTDQRCQFTVAEFVKAIEEKGSRLSGIGSWSGGTMLLLNDYGNP